MASSCHLTHTDPSRNMARYYRMTIQPTLFGEWSLVREWGRIGRGGQIKVTPYLTRAEAEAALAAISLKKERREYIRHF